MSVEAKKVTQPKWHTPTPVTEQPQLKLYNSLTKTKNPFVSIKPNEIKWYSCGPTVYDSSHMGHARNYVTIDINRRILQDYFGYNVTFVQNVTDIDDKIIIRARQNYLFEEKIKKQYKTVTDELVKYTQESLVEYIKKNVNLNSVEELNNWLATSKTEELAAINPKYPMYYKALQKATESIKYAKTIPVEEFLANVQDIVVPKLDRELGSSVVDPEIFKSLPSYWENQYDIDMQQLNVLPADIKTRVSEYVPEIVEFVEKIISNGFAYKTADGSVYFNTNAFESSDKHSYAKLQPWNKGSLSLISEGEGSLTSNAGGKLSPNDFALWKASKPGEPAWESPWGKGRPGWHIECSVMASDVLGEQMDIHSGGIDLAFPHHDNELAQSEAFFDNKQWVNYFLHTGHLHIEGQKMSKSLKNFITIQEALEKYSAKQLRLSFALIPWNNQLDFKDTLLNQVKSIENTYNKFFLNVRSINSDIHDRINNGEIISEKFGESEKKLLEDLNTARDQVHEAFCDNLSTPTVIKVISELINTTNLYIANNSDMRIRPVVVIAKYITKILSILGFDARADSLGWKTETEGSSGGSESEEIKLQFAKTISNIRDEIRKYGIESKNQVLLTLSDKIRDEDLLNLGISIDDRTEGNGLVKILNKAEQEQLINQRNEKLQKIKEKEKKKLEQQRLKEQQEKEKLEKASLKPQDMFQDKSKYSEWDAEGIPTKDVNGEEVTKSAKKKLVKQWTAQKKLHEQYFPQNN
ncbi:cysteine--tRNA ligase [Saccharomycopsis crataegensis]|uniref:cysteine--tRNA ligase n=1 Tax=Saccharomycopsis crataegensis TaxID=43959 RepID=A0AAV5QG13_9ASCO|nr:cysteine--tRNA ligase [Saccharomycopsis crataegensis]